MLSGLLDNPELRVVLVFGYNCCKVGASNYLQRVVSTFSDMNVILAGGQVDNLASLTSEKYVCAPRPRAGAGCLSVSWPWGLSLKALEALLSRRVVPFCRHRLGAHAARVCLRR